VLNLRCSANGRLGPFAVTVLPLRSPAGPPLPLLPGADIWSHTLTEARCFYSQMAERRADSAKASTELFRGRIFGAEVCGVTRISDAVTQGRVPRLAAADNNRKREVAEPVAPVPPLPFSNSVNPSARQSEGVRP
jgi:hypothetical protein